MDFRDHLYPPPIEELNEGAKWDSFKDSMRSLGHSVRSTPHIIGLKISDKLYRKGYGGEKMRNFANRRGQDATTHLLKAMDYHDKGLTKLGKSVKDEHKIMYYNLLRANQRFNNALENIQ